MIVAVHALAGAALSRLCRTGKQAFALGFLSHLPCDLIPHRDLEVPSEAALLGATLALIAAARGPASKEFVGALGAAAADLENLVGRVLKLPDERLLIPTHSKCHGREVRSFTGQIGLALGCLAVICWPGSTH